MQRWAWGEVVARKWATLHRADALGPDLIVGPCGTKRPAQTFSLFFLEALIWTKELWVFWSKNGPTSSPTSSHSDHSASAEVGLLCKAIVINVHFRSRCSLGWLSRLLGLDQLCGFWWILADNPCGWKIYGNIWHFLYSRTENVVKLSFLNEGELGALKRILRIFLESREWSILCTFLYRFRTGQDHTRPSSNKISKCRMDSRWIARWIYHDS